MRSLLSSEWARTLAAPLRRRGQIRDSLAIWAAGGPDGEGVTASPLAEQDQVVGQFPIAIILPIQ